MPMYFINRFHLRLALAITTALLVIFFSAGLQSESGARVGAASTFCPTQLLQNGGFELPLDNPRATPQNWNIGQWRPGSDFSRHESNAHFGTSGISIMAETANDAWFWQQVTVEPETQYMLTGWIKTQNVSGGAGANLSLIGTWTHTEGLFGTNDWTYVSLWFNSGSNTQMTIGARLGYWAGTSSGMAWFDDLRLTPITPDGTHPRWKILVLIYNKTDAVVTDTAGVRHHMVATMTPTDVERATLAATQFVETDIPALTSGNMIPELTIRYPDHALTQLDPYGQAWWPSARNTASDRDPAFDSVIVIWDPRVVDEYTGTRYWIGPGAGVAAGMGASQTYCTIIIEATGYGHRNVFKHEWGHSILFYFDSVGASPKPAVTNHSEIGQYVHWPTGDAYVWIDETDANLIPNSIYNNESGFTHDYYSGTTATADQPTRRLGVTPEAWMLGGPVTKPGVSSQPPPVITSSGDIAVTSNAGACSARVTLPPATVSDECESNLKPVVTRSDGLPLEAAYSCGQTVVTWSVTNSANLTSTSKQVVTVSDGTPPVFSYVPPPVTITTGSGATSCGAIVDDARLAGAAPAANPVVLDPIGDTGPPWASRHADIISTTATFDHQSLTFRVSFADRIYPGSSGDRAYLQGYIDIDTDQNPQTGGYSAVDLMAPPAINLGVEFQIDLISELGHPGFVNIVSKQGGYAVVGKLPILFTDTSFSVTVPLTMLGGDNGLVNYGVGVGVQGFGQTDRVPNGALPATSVPVPELIALDDCAGVTISRTGVPANNLFPVGETLVTYTATDASGNQASVTQIVIVVDNTPPAISGVRASPSILWPPNHDMVDVTVSYEATDSCAILESWLSVSSNQPGNNPDAEVVDAHHVRLRATRPGRWGERLYTVTISAKDIHGNASSQNVIVVVPQSRGEGGAKS